MDDHWGFGGLDGAKPIEVARVTEVASFPKRQLSVICHQIVAVRIAQRDPAASDPIVAVREPAGERPLRRIPDASIKLA
jgi:hypothetical protein